MFPTFATLTTTPDGLRWAGYVLVVLLATYLLVDGHRQRGLRGWPATVAVSVGFGVAGFVAVTALLTQALPPHLSIPLRSWGLMAVLGMIVCYGVQLRLGRPAGLTSDNILSVWLFGTLAAVVGARALHVLVNWRGYAAAPGSVLMVWDGGLVFLGGVVAALLTTGLYLRRLGAGLAALDAIVLGLALAHGLGRVGCFLAGCCFGRETSSALGVSFPPGSIAQYALAEAGRIAPDAWTPPLHPTQLYSAIVCFALGLLLLRLHRRPGVVAGSITALYFVLYPATRFFLEMLRADPERQFAFRLPAEEPLVLSTTQALSLLIVPAAILGYRIARTRRAGTAAAESYAGDDLRGPIEPPGVPS